MNQQPGALDVAKKLYAKSGAKVRALDEPRHIGNHERFEIRLLAHRYHAQVGSRVVNG